MQDVVTAILFFRTTCFPSLGNALKQDQPYTTGSTKTTRPPPSAKHARKPGGMCQAAPPHCTHFWSFAHFVTPCFPFDRHKSLSLSSLQQPSFLLLSEATLRQLSTPGDLQKVNLPRPMTCFKNIIISSVTEIATLPAIDGRPSFWIGQIR